jgi:hypothetical protein
MPDAVPTTAPTLPPAGWYAHPALPGSDLWWSGVEWTQHARPTGSESAPATGPFTGQPYSLETTDGGPTAKTLQPAITSLVFGILSLALNAFFLASIVAIARGRQALTRAKALQLDGTPPHGRTLALWGSWLGVAGLLMGAFQSWLVIAAWSEYLF